MSEKEFYEQDKELFNMVNGNNSTSRTVVGVILPARELPALAKAEEDLHLLYAEKQKMKRIGSVAARLGVGLLCIGAMARNMMDPMLAIGAAAACCVWAAAGYWRDAYGKVHSAR